MRLGHVISYVVNTPWAILPEKMSVILDLLAFHAVGGQYTVEEIRERIGVQHPATGIHDARVAFAAEDPHVYPVAASQAERPSGVGVAVLPVYGVIHQRANLMTDTSGGTSVERLTAQFRQALADPSVGAVVLDVDSPGGAVPGIEELSAEMHGARGSKPILAVANSLAASAAYWIATAADEVVVTPSGEVGSIGVFAVHEDFSAALEAEGVRVTLISAGKFKMEGNPYEPLGEVAREALQARVDDYYGMFVKAVARNRGVTAKDVREGFGEGRVVGAGEAKRLGMVDRVETFDAAVARLLQRVNASARRRTSPQARTSAMGMETRQRRVRARLR